MHSRQLCRTLVASLIVLAGAAWANGLPAAEVNSLFAKAHEQAQARCVKIFGAGIGRVEGYGTGIVVSDKGHVLTASGVMLSGRQIYVVTPDGERYKATVLRRSQDLQAAMLQVWSGRVDKDSNPLPLETPDHFELKPTVAAQKGDWVLSVSNLFKVADGREHLSVNLGILSLRTALDTKRGTQDIPYAADVLLIDAITSNPGAAGGAIVDVEGNLVGMVGKTLESRDTRTRLNYGVPADLLFKFFHGQPLNEAAAVVKVPGGGKPYLGIRVFSLGIGSKALAYVDRVATGSPGHKAGLRSDDLIVAIGPQTVHDIREYKKIVATLTPGEEISFLVKRKNDLIEIPVTPTTKEED